VSRSELLEPCPGFADLVRTHKDIVYCNGHVEGKVFCLRVDPDGAIEVLDEAVAGGVGPTHLALNQDHTGLLIAHVCTDYHSGRPSLVLRWCTPR
jgi:6-phosphogluconolactonase (cycloisomerase 2 family)